MGSHIIMDDDLHRVELEDGEWVDILEKVPRALRQKAIAAAVKTTGHVTPGQEVGEMDISVDMGARSDVLLHGMVKAWSFKDKAEKPIPVNAANIDRLDDETSDFVIAEIDRLNPERSPKEKKG